MFHIPRGQWIGWIGALLVLFSTAIVVAHPDGYDRTMRGVFLHEGGWFNHPHDPGGATMYGITIHDVRRYINPRATPADVRRITRAQAAQIYRTRYWDAVRGDELPLGLDYTVMDLGVNSGVGRARSFLREHIEVPVVHMGPLTDADLAAVRAECEGDNCAELIGRINDRRYRFVHSLRTCVHFCRGWDRRIAHVRRESLSMAGITNRAMLGEYRAPIYGEGFGRAIEHHEDLTQ